MRPSVSRAQACRRDSAVRGAVRAADPKVPMSAQAPVAHLFPSSSRSRSDRSLQARSPRRGAGSPRQRGPLLAGGEVLQTRPVRSLRRRRRRPDRRAAGDAPPLPATPTSRRWRRGTAHRGRGWRRARAGTRPHSPSPGLQVQVGPVPHWASRSHRPPIGTGSTRIFFSRKQSTLPTSGSPTRPPHGRHIRRGACNRAWGRARRRAGAVAEGPLEAGQLGRADWRERDRQRRAARSRRGRRGRTRAQPLTAISSVSGTGPSAPHHCCRRRPRPGRDRRARRPRTRR